LGNGLEEYFAGLYDDVKSILNFEFLIMNFCYFRETEISLI
jgi:hypothetical protein